jgi:chromosome segregation ATPase
VDVERTIEFLLSQQVPFDERQARFEEWQLRAAAQFDRLAAQQEETSKEVQTIAGAVHVLIRSVEEDRAALRELREDLTQVTGNVNGLVKVVDDLVRRGNGRQHS